MLVVQILVGAIFTVAMLGVVVAVCRAIGYEDREDEDDG